MADVRIEAKLEPVWATIRKIRQQMLEVLSDATPENRKAASMVASELLENAIKYGEPVPESSGILFAFSASVDAYRIVVTNGARLGPNVERLMERIRAIEEAEDRAALYLGRLHELLEEPSQDSGLGIYRIGFEGGFDLEGDFADNVVTVSATRRLA